MSKVKQAAAEAREKLTKKKEPKEATNVGLSSGCTLVNLALTGKPSIGFHTGCFFLLVGDSRAGKSFVALQTLAEASINKAFDDHRLLYFAPERGARMDFGKFFGKRMAERTESLYPSTVEKFYFDLDDAMANGPVIAVLDSMDGLESEDDKEKFQEQKAAAAKGKDAAGSYGTSKARANSTRLRSVVNRLAETGSILLIISQTRDNIGFGAMFNPKTRSGGKALTFFATGELWFSVKESIKRTVRGKPRKIGVVLQVAIKKNRDTGREPVVELIHHPDVGFDDVGSVCDWLIEEGHWKEAKGVVKAEEFNHEGRREDLIKFIESEDREHELRLLAASVWQEIEEGCQVERKNRYK